MYLDTKITGKIEFKDVSFSYDGSKQILDSICLLYTSDAADE